MGKQRLNHLVLLYVHKDHTDSFDLKGTQNNFVSDSEHGLGQF